MRVGVNGHVEVVDGVLCGHLHTDILFSVKERTTRMCVHKGQAEVKNKPFGRDTFLQWPMAVVNDLFTRHLPALAWTVEHLN